LAADAESFADSFFTGTGRSFQMFADSAVEAQGKAEKSASWRTFQKTARSRLAFLNSTFRQMQAQR
jgi:hypothetical protein